jgi:DNA polymerase III delta prime subunit
MFLKQFVFVNWGNLPNGEFEFGPVSLFSGANGSGKTTAADAVQTIMTAAHETLFHYNPGQEETTQRGRGGKRVRTLASYVLGCDDGSYARTEPTDGYIAAVFHPTPGETADVFSAVIAVRAWLDQSGKMPLAREEALQFFVLPGVEVDLSAFVETKDGVAHIVLMDEIQSALVKRCGRSAVERYDQKRTYLRRLYAALRGKRDSVSEREAMAAARAFSRFMAYKPVSGINQFVADEVLERKDLGEAIRSVSSQLKTIHSMEREAHGLKESAQLLERAASCTQQYIDAWTDLQTHRYTEARAGYNETQARYLKTRTDRDAMARALEQNAAELELAAQRHEQIRGTLISLEAQRQGVPALQQKDALEAEHRRLDAQLIQTASELLQQDRQLQQSFAASRELAPLMASAALQTDLPEATDLEGQRLLNRVRELEAVSDLDIPGLMQKDLTGDLSHLEKHLDESRLAQSAHAELRGYWHVRTGEEDSRRDRAAGLHQRRRQRYESLSASAQQKQQEIARLEAKQTIYPAYVERALTAIRAQCPQADARVLCDHIEVVDSRWQAAIEGYLGGARFSIIVDAAYEAQAIRIVRSLSGRDNHASVLQGEKALRDAARIKPDAQSVVHVLKFTHAVAQAFLTASYGAVVRVASENDLPRTPRGVTVDGMGSRSYRMFRCDLPDSELVFGAAARERALAAKRAELTRLTQERQDANGRMQESHRLLDCIDRLAELSYAEALARVLGLHRDLRRTEMLLSRIDISAYRSLDAQLEQLRQEEAALLKHIAGLNAHQGTLQERLENLAKSIERLSTQKDEAQSQMSAAEDALRAVHTQWPEFDLDARFAFAEQEAKTFDAMRAQRDREEIEGRMRKAEHALGTALLEHNQKSRAADKIVYVAFGGAYDEALFGAICELRREIDRVYNILRNNVLVEKHEHLKQLKASFNNAFVAHLCQEINQAIQEGKRQLDQLNRELVNHRFGSDREGFRFAQEWVPEYREYARFFEEVARNPAADGELTLFEAKLSPKSAQVRDELMSLLLGADEQKSLRDLERISDYRNYHRYEIYKEVEGKPPIALSEYGTGSGGQLETPAYIIRSASITSAWRYVEGATHLRMVLVDEAFSKMDETRSREVIDYLTNTLGLQLLFIMPTSKCGPFMDLISNEFVFAKVPSAPRGQLRTRVLVDRKECNRPRIEQLWARHRRTVHQQAELEFMADVLGETGTDS